MKSKTNSKSIDTQLQKLEKRLKKLRAQKSKRARKNKLRRQTLIGKVYLKRITKESGAWEEIKKVMNVYLKRNSDRHLFDLPPTNK